MLREDFEQSPDYDLMLFIGKNYQSMEAKFLPDGSDFVCTNGNTRVDPIKWFKLLIVYFGFTAQSIEDEEKQIAFCAQALTNTVQLVESLYEMIDEVPSCKRYNFSGVIRRVESLVQLGKTELEAKLLNSQIATNTSVVETNTNVRETNENIKATNSNTISNNRLMRNILLLTFLVSLVSAGVTVLDYLYVKSKDKSEQNIEQKDSTIQALQLLLSQTKKENDSSTVVSDSATHKP